MAHFLAIEEGPCETCPMLFDEGTPHRTNKLCLGEIEYPFSLQEMSPRIEVVVASEEDLPGAMTDFTQQVFAALGRPGVKLHPRALRRAVVGGKRGALCPGSWPTPVWASLVIEQVSFDLAGMQPRLLYDDRPWLEQPAIYTDCYQVVASAKKVADDWVKESKERKSSERGSLRK